MSVPDRDSGGDAHGARTRGDARRFVFRARHRIGHKREFQAVYEQGIRRVHGAIAVYGRPNGLPDSRLGLSVGRRVGNAVKRGRMKRLVREAFRLMRDEMPTGYDLVVSVRPHRELPLARYEESLRDCWKSIDREWKRRSRSPSN